MTWVAGRAAALAFARGGYTVVLVDRDKDGGASALAEAVARHGRVDAAFNAAGVDGEMLPVAEASIENWDRIMGINLRGLWFCMRQQIRQMLKQGGGAIVNCASSAGLVGVPHLSAYVASKHGVAGLTKSAALEYVRSNIRVNAVCPGMIDTPMWRKSIMPELTEALLARDPCGRLGQPSEIAAAALWLCSPAASFVTGQALAVDGGMTAD